MIHRLYLGKLKDGYDEGLSGSYDVVNSIDAFGLVLQSAPLVSGAKAKAPYKRSWYDMDGDDEYIPQQLMLESQILKYRLITKGLVFSATHAYYDLLRYLTGSDDGKPMFAIYDDWSRGGWYRCRMEELVQTGNPYRTWDGANGGDEDILELELSVKVLDPSGTWAPSSEISYHQ